MRSNGSARARLSDLCKRLLPTESANRGDSSAEIDLASHAILAHIRGPCAPDGEF
jgi:hypothetical protein